MKKRAFFFDRDGVLVDCDVVGGSPFPRHGSMNVSNHAQEVCDQLRSKSFLLICVTNQPDIARGQVPESVVASDNAYVKESLHLDAVYSCPHDTRDRCSCRKPRPGMLIEAAQQFDIDLGLSYMVGDRSPDITAGGAAGCVTVFLDRGYEEPVPAGPDWVIQDLRAITSTIIP